MEGEAEGGGGGLVVGEQEDEDLLAQLGRVEAAVLGALGLDEQRQQVLAVAGGGRAGAAPLGDDAVADLVQRPVDGGRAAVAGVGQSRGTLSGE